MRRDSRESPERLASHCASSGVRIKSQALESPDLAASIISLAEKQAIDLIILGTHARRGVTKLILGSCAEGVIRHASCPVITIGPNVKEPTENECPFDSIVFATDLAHVSNYRRALYNANLGCSRQNGKELTNLPLPVSDEASNVIT